MTRTSYRLLLLALTMVGSCTTSSPARSPGSGGAGAVFVDDVNCWLRIPVTITPSVSSPNLRLSFPTQIGVTNLVQYKNDLSDANWQLLQTVVGDLSGQAAVPAPMNVPRRFYRVSAEW